MVHTVGIGPHLPCHHGDAFFPLFFVVLRERERAQEQTTTKKKRLKPTVSKIEEFCSSVDRSAHFSISSTVA
jgi:hypothetical protein